MKLLACPFCGEDEGANAPAIENINGERPNYPRWYRVRCFRCSVTTGDFREPELAEARWNMRSKPKSETFGTSLAK